MIIDVLNRIRGPFNLSTAALAAAEAAVRDTAYVAKCRGGQRPLARLAGHGVGRDRGADRHFDRELHSRPLCLRRRGQRLRRSLDAPKVFWCAASAGYKLPNCLRITVGDESACRRIVHAVAQFKGLRT